MIFDDLPVHDAVLSSLHVSYEAARCEVVLYPVGQPRHALVFEGFVALNLPRREPWGPSSSINVARQVQDQLFELELCSGDVLSFEATVWSYRIDA